MLMVCHHLDPNLPEDVAFAESRIRGETIAAEDILHDLGAISMMSSDSQAMGRIGEVITRTWQTADKMKQQRGALPGEKGGNDNLRIKRYISKYTINPAIAHGVSHLVGSIEVGQTRRPRACGSQRCSARNPRWSSKAASSPGRRWAIRTRAFPRRNPFTCVRCSERSAARSAALPSRSSANSAKRRAWPKATDLTKRIEAVRNCRNIGKRDMKWNDALPKITVDPETYEVRADGELLKCEPASVLPLAQRYFLF